MPTMHVFQGNADIEIPNTSLFMLGMAILIPVISFFQENTDMGIPNTSLFMLRMGIIIQMMPMLLEKTDVLCINASLLILVTQRRAPRMPIFNADTGFPVDQHLLFLLFNNCQGLKSKAAGILMYFCD